MSDCCTPSSGFPNAATMQTLATNHPIIWSEICGIQQAILAASSQCQPSGGKMKTVIAGTTPMTWISGLKAISVIDSGSGYFIDSPDIVFIPPLGSAATGATATPITNGGAILSVTIDNSGTGYQPVNSTLAVSSVAGTSAVLQPLVNSLGQIAAVNVINGGSGYTLLDSVVATRALAPNPAYINATFRISTISPTGQIIAVDVMNPGTGYEPSVTTMRVVSQLNPLVNYPVGSGFFGVILTNSSGAITGVTVTNSGAGYANLRPTLAITNPGTGAQTQVNLTGTGVSSIDIIRPGNNYVMPITGTVVNPSTAIAATVPATVSITINENTYGTNPVQYWNVWAGAETNQQISAQLNTVLSYFKALGYTIEIQSNPTTGNTIQWALYW